MFRLDRLLRFVGHVLRALIPSLVVVLALSLLTQIVRRVEDLPEDILTPQFWTRVALGIVPLLLAFGSAFLLAARFLREVYPKLKRRDAIRFILYSRFGRPGFGPWIKIQGGKTTAGADNVVSRIGGPGALIVSADNAVVLEQGGVFASVQGPGFPQLKPFEKVYDIIDLAPKSYCYSVSAMSREGILLDWDVEVQYQVADGGFPLAEGAFYSFSPDDVFRASTSKWMREKGWKYGQDMDWEGLLVISQAEGTLRSIVARRPLDQLIGLTEGEAQVAKLAIQSELEEDLRKYAPTIGAKILRVRLDNLQVRDEVAKQWIETWKARWQSWSAERLAHGEAANIFQYEKVKAEAQAEMIRDIAQALRDFVADQSFPRQAIPQMVLMRLFSVLDRADFAASSRVFFPTQTLDALETIRRPVKGRFQSNVTTLVANPSSITVTDSTTILATIRDGAGDPVPDGTEVVFSTSAGSLSALTARTANSVAQTTLTAGRTAGKAQVWAQASGPSASMTVRFVPGPPSDVTLVASPTSIEAGGEVELFAEARDAYQNPVADGTPALFRTTLGSLSAGSVETNKGRAQTRLTARGKVGQADVSVQIGQHSASQQVSFLPGAPHSLALTAGALEVVVDHDVRIRATVTDAWGNPVADGTTVAFHSSGGLITSQADTKHGETTAILNQATAAGEAQVTAQVAGLSSYTTVNFLPGPPSAVSLLVSPASIEVGGEVELFAEVKDAFGNPVSDGTPVRFHTTLGSLSATSVETEQGRAQSSLTADGRAGQSEVSAHVGEQSDSQKVDFLPGAAHRLALSADSLDVEVGHDVCIQVNVLDPWGNAVADGTTVTFESSGGSLSAGLTGTLGGVAMVFWAAGSVPGLFRVISTSMEATGSVELHVTPGPPNLLSLTARAASIEVGSETELFVLVQDVNGNSVADGTEVSFHVTQGKVWPPVGQTKSGLAHAELVASKNPGRAKVSASAGRAQHAIGVDFVPGKPHTVELVVEASSVRRNDRVGVFIMVRDAFGNDVADGTSVVLTGDLGKPDKSIVETEKGDAHVTFTAGSRAGMAKVTARAGSIEASQPIAVE